MAYELIWESSGVVKRHYGVLTAGDMLAATRQVVNHQRFSELRYIVNDFSDVESGRIGLATIEEIAALRIGATLVNSRILSPYIAATDPGLSVAHLLMSPDYRNDHPTRLFPSLPAARAWVAEQLHETNAREKKPPQTG